MVPGSVRNWIAVKCSSTIQSQQKRKIKNEFQNKNVFNAQLELAGHGEYRDGRSERQLSGPIKTPRFRECGFNGSYQSFFSNRRDDGADGARIRSYGQYFWESYASYFQFFAIRIFRFECSVREFTGPRA